MALGVLLLAASAAMIASGQSTAGARTALPARDAASTPRDSLLQGALDRWAAVAGHQGVSASVIFSNGSRWEGTAGFGGGTTPVRPSDLIAIASITKSMTGAIIMQLAQERRLTLDDPVSRWLPTREHVNPAITVRQLLNHTSGVANYTGTAGLSAAISADTTHVFTRDELLAFVGPPVFDAGARTQYTNTAFLLLGAIAEKASGLSIVELYRRRLWKPLGLTEIFLPGIEAPKGKVAPARTAMGVTDPLSRMSTLSVGNSAFGLLASARTVASWGRALFAGHVLSPSMQLAMRTIVPAAGNIPGESGAGLGIRSYFYLGRTQYGHSGGSPFGSSLLLYDPDTGITVAVLMNQGPGADHFDLAPRLLRIASGDSGFR